MPYRHEALFDASQEALLEAGVPWLREGLDAGEVIALACEADNNAVLAAALGGHPAVRVLPQERIYHRGHPAKATLETYPTPRRRWRWASDRCKDRVGKSSG
jgi:hypothetical protein